MEIKTAELPGIGKKYTFYTAVEGICVVVIIHTSGHREMYFLNCEEDDEVLFSFELNDDEARKLGSILLGSDFDPVSDAKVEFMKKGILIRWIDIPEDSHVVNKKLYETNLRRNTGVIPIGIKRGEDIIADIDEIILPNDTLMIVGKQEQIEKAESWLREGE